MRFIQSVISTVCAILIIICSIAQFHHHDHDGKMVVFSCTEELACNHAEHHHDALQCIEHNTCSHGCHDGHHQDEKNCSLKINIVKPENKQIAKVIIACMVITDLIANVCDIIRIFYVQTDIDISCNEFNSIIGLRAPPAL